MDGRVRPLLLSFGLRRAPQGAGLVAAGAKTSHSPLVREHPPHQSFPPATGSETPFAATSTGSGAQRGVEYRAGRTSASAGPLTNLRSRPRSAFSPALGDQLHDCRHIFASIFGRPEPPLALSVVLLFIVPFLGLLVAVVFAAGTVAALGALVWKIVASLDALIRFVLRPRPRDVRLREHEQPDYLLRRKLRRRSSTTGPDDPADASKRWGGPWKWAFPIVAGRITPAKPFLKLPRRRNQDATGSGLLRGHDDDSPDDAEVVGDPRRASSSDTGWRPCLSPSVVRGMVRALAARSLRRGCAGRA